MDKTAAEPKDAGNTSDSAGTAKAASTSKAAPSLKAASTEEKDGADEEKTYTVNVQIGEELTGVTVTLRESSSGKTYSGKASHVEASGIVGVENVPSGTYFVNVTGTNKDGVGVKSGSSYEQLYPFMFNNAKNGVVTGVYISNFIADVNGEVTVSISVTHPYKAKDGQQYAIAAENITGYLQGTDGTKYTLKVGSDGYVKAQVPANQQYIIAILSAWDYGRIDGGTIDKTVKYTLTKGLGWMLPAEKCTGDITVPISITEQYIKVENFDAEKYSFRINVTDEENDDAAVDKAAVTVTDPDGKEYTGTTDAKGNADFEVPIPDKRQGTDSIYSVTAKADDGRKATVTFHYTDLKDSTGLFTRSVKLPVIASFYADREVYVNGEKVYSTSPEQAFKKDGNDVHIPAILGFYDIAKCTKVEAFDKDGNPIKAKLYDVAGANTGYATIAAADKADIGDGERILVKYYYEYTDQNTEYKINVKHEFRNAAGDVVYTEEASTKSAAGIKVNAESDPAVDMLRSHDENWVQRNNLPGYRDGAGAWFVSTTKVSGGSSNPIVGTVDSTTTPKNPVSFEMPHTDVDIVITYVYSDTYLEYDANNPNATGSMYTDWARNGEIKVIKCIDGSKGEPAEEPEGTEEGNGEGTGEGTVPETDVVVTGQAMGDVTAQSTAGVTAQSTGGVTAAAAGGYQLDGYNFVGWNTAKDGSGTWYYPGSQLQINQSTTLYAQWAAITPSGTTKYSVFYKFVSETPGKQLPAKIANLKTAANKGMLPASEMDKYTEGSTATPVSPAKGTEVKVDGGKWVFNGYDKSKITFKDGMDPVKDCTFTGSWAFVADNSPADHDDSAPDADNGSSKSGSSTSSNGTASSGATKTGDGASLGILLGLMGLAVTAAGALIFARRREQ